MGFRNPITTVAALDTGGNAPGVRIYASQNNPGSGVVEWDAYSAIARGTLTSSLTGSGGTFFALGLSGGPALQLNLEENTGGGGYSPVIRATGGPLYVDSLAGLAYARLIATGNAPLTGTYGAGLWNGIPWGAAPLDSHGGFGLPGTTGWKVPAGQAGIYALSGQVVFTADGSNPTRNARIVVNGNVFAGFGGPNAALGTSAGVSALTGVKVVQLNVGDVVAVQGFSSNAWATTTFPDSASNLEVIRLR